MLGCKLADTLIDSNYKLGLKENRSHVDIGRYQELVGKLIYLSHTKPNIGFSISVVSQFMNMPNEDHLEVVYKILRYLKMTHSKCIFFKKGKNKKVEIFIDADWAVQLQIKDIQLFIELIFGGILSHGIVKSSQLLLGVVLRQDFVP